MRCTKCGQQISPDDKFCKMCGQPVMLIDDERLAADTAHAEAQQAEYEKRFKRNRNLLIVAALALLAAAAAIVIVMNFSGREIEGISLNPDAVSINPGETKEIEAVVTPAKAAGTALEWMSTNDAVASVDHGTVTAIKAGTCIVSAYSTEDYSIYGMVKITVTGGDAKVEKSAADDTLSLTDYNCPTSIKKGELFSIHGTVTSASSAISKVTVGVYDMDGALQTGTSANPNVKSYNVTKLDEAVYFNYLNPGDYYYSIEATNASGTSTLLKQQFTVTG